jgi:hypothetical protein
MKKKNTKEENKIGMDLGDRSWLDGHRAFIVLFFIVLFFFVPFVTSGRQPVQRDSGSCAT